MAVFLNRCLWSGIVLTPVGVFFGLNLYFDARRNGWASWRKIPPMEAAVRLIAIFCIPVGAIAGLIGVIGLLVGATALTVR